MIKRES